MKRRDFIKNAPLAVVPLFSNKLFAAPMSVSIEDAAFFNAVTGEDRILVIVQMDGGNDGLNTVLPLDQYSNLAAARSNILIPDTSALLLGSFQTGLHPSMTGMKSLYDQNMLCVVQGVSYASPNLSHFRSGDIFTSGSDSNQVIESGWLGRYLEYVFPNYPQAYPNALMPDPLAVQIGSSITRGLMGYDVSTAQLVPSSYNGSLTQLLSYQNTTTPSTNAGNEVAFLRNQQLYADQYALRINDAWGLGTNMQAYGGASIAQQLRVVARLIKGGLKSKVYWVRQGGYDTHSNQVGGSTTTGTHATLLGDLSDAIHSFMNDIVAMGLEDKVMGLTFSEFGRRVKSNASTGTDHGSAGPMFIFGTHVNPTVVGTNAIIPANATSSTNVPTQFDFRQVYQSILQGWFCLSASAAGSIVSSQSPIQGTDTSCNLVLPIELLKFSVDKANMQDAHIEWITATEQNVTTFEIERSYNGVKFEKIATLPAKGHSHEPVRYEHLDKNLVIDRYEIFYYRLKINEADATTSYSELRTVKFEQSAKFSAEIFPNPNYDGLLHIKLNGNLKLDNNLDITLTDSFGRRIIQFSQSAFLIQNNQIDLNLDSISEDGIYFISIKYGDNFIGQKLVLSR
jgi:uncharacterized protein (DUF1501 family)